MSGFAVRTMVSWNVWRRVDHIAGAAIARVANEPSRTIVELTSGLRAT